MCFILPVQLVPVVVAIMVVENCALAGPAGGDVMYFCGLETYLHMLQNPANGGEGSMETSIRRK